MPSVQVKFKYKQSHLNSYSTHTGPATVSKKPPSESEVLAALQKAHPSWRDFVILEIK